MERHAGLSVTPQREQSAERQSARLLGSVIAPKGLRRPAEYRGWGRPIAGSARPSVVNRILRAEAEKAGRLGGAGARTVRARLIGAEPPTLSQESMMITADRRIKRDAHAWRTIVRRHRWRIRIAQFLRRLIARLDP